LTGETLHAPHLIDIEVAQVHAALRGTGQIEPGRCRDALDDLSDFPLIPYPHDVVAGAGLGMRHNLRLTTPFTLRLPRRSTRAADRDRRLAAAAGHDARVDLV